MADFEHELFGNLPVECNWCFRGQEGAGLRPCRVEVGTVPASEIMRGGSLVLRFLDAEGEALALVILDSFEVSGFVTQTERAAASLGAAGERVTDSEGALAVAGGQHV